MLSWCTERLPSAWPSAGDHLNEPREEPDEPDEPDEPEEEEEPPPRVADSEDAAPATPATAEAPTSATPGQRRAAPGLARRVQSVAAQAVPCPPTCCADGDLTPCSSRALLDALLMDIYKVARWHRVF